jgi:hypothetical protein
MMSVATADFFNTFFLISAVGLQWIRRCPNIYTWSGLECKQSTQPHVYPKFDETAGRHPGERNPASPIETSSYTLSFSGGTWWVKGKKIN